MLHRLEPVTASCATDSEDEHVWTWPAMVCNFMDAEKMRRNALQFLLEDNFVLSDYEEHRGAKASLALVKRTATDVDDSTQICLDMFVVQTVLVVDTYLCTELCCRNHVHVVRAVLKRKHRKTKQCKAQHSLHVAVM